MNCRRYMLNALAVTVLLGTTGDWATAGTPFPVDYFAFPVRSAADVSDIYALRFNPAGLSHNSDVELAYLHHFVRSGPGGNHALMLRLKTLSASVNWIEHPVYGNRREYLVGSGGSISPQADFGLTYRYIKADDTSLQNRSTWTAGVRTRLATGWIGALVWENVSHSRVAGEKTRGQFTAAISTRPVGPRLNVALDWIYPEGTRLEHTDLRLSGRLWVVPKLTAHFFVDTNERVGIELRFFEKLNAVGGQLRLRDITDWADGTVYISGSNQPYPNSQPDPTGPRRY